MQADNANDYFQELLDRCESYLVTYGKILAGLNEALDTDDSPRLSGYADLEFVYGRKLTQCISAIEGLSFDGTRKLPPGLQELSAQTLKVSVEIHRRISDYAATLQQSLKEVRYRMRSVGAAPLRGGNPENRYIHLSA
ncbi:MAG: hypothetical protein JXB03_01625 [Spirochaetales bacterium]|nr:hypothetical protein [Spirochaetales bacterium]